MNLTLGQQIVGQIGIHSFRPGRVFSGYAIQIALQVTTREQPNPKAAIFFDQVSVVVGFINSGAEFIGVARPIRAPFTFCSYEHSGNHQSDFELLLDHQTLKKIEEVRSGNDLRFRIKLSTLAHRGGEKTRLEAEVEQPVSQSDWIKLLNEIGYSSIFLLEVPLPCAGNHVSAPFKYLSEAHVAYLRGDWREVVGKCRDVVESAAQIYSMEKIHDDLLVIGQSRGTDKWSRLSVIRRALHVFMHPARHPEGSPERFEREDAYFAISACAGFLDRLSKFK